MIDVLRGVRADEYRSLWGRVPRSVGSVLWMAFVAGLGWETGFWIGGLAIVALTVLCRSVPSSFRPAELLVDITYATVMKATVARVLWLALLADLWIVQDRGPSSLLMVLVLYVLSPILPFAARLGLNRLPKSAT